MRKRNELFQRVILFERQQQQQRQQLLQQQAIKQTTFFNNNTKKNIIFIARSLALSRETECVRQLREAKRRSFHAGST
jgi:hypothetical protein